MGIPSLIMPLAGFGLCLHCLRPRTLKRWTERKRSPGCSHRRDGCCGAHSLQLPMYVATMDWEVLGLLSGRLFWLRHRYARAFALMWGVCFVLLVEQQPLMIIPQTMFNASSNFILTAIPFFMFTGAVMEIGGLAERLVVLAQALVGRFRGGLLHADILVSAIFADMSGSAVSDTVAIGNVMLPGMVRRGYDKAFASALQAASGTLGVLFPPSIATIIYAWVGNVSVAQMFLASFLPSFMVAISFASSRRSRLQAKLAAGTTGRRSRNRPCVPGRILGPAHPLPYPDGNYLGRGHPHRGRRGRGPLRVVTSRFIYRRWFGEKLRKSLMNGAMGTSRVMFILRPRAARLAADRDAGAAEPVGRHAARSRTIRWCCCCC